MGNIGFIYFEITINIVVTSFRFIWIYAVCLDYYKYFDELLSFYKDQSATSGMYS